MYEREREGFTSEPAVKSRAVYASRETGNSDVYRTLSLFSIFLIRDILPLLNCSHVEIFGAGLFSCSTCVVESLRAGLCVIQTIFRSPAFDR